MNSDIERYRKITVGLVEQLQVIVEEVQFIDIFQREDEFARAQVILEMLQQSMSKWENILVPEKVRKISDE